MNTLLELLLFSAAVIAVIGFGIWKARDEIHAKEAGASGYFLAGRGLTWWLVGFSLIAANISTEQFVGMSGSAANWLGMAVASYEWMAAVTLVFVAFFFLPRFLRTGIFTIPEFLEYRYGPMARLAMALLTIFVLVLVPTASVIFSGAKFVSGYYPDIPLLGNLTAGCWLIGLLAAVYVFAGGLKACAWTDLIWGSGLVLGGALVLWLALGTLGEVPAERLIETKVANSEATVADLEKAGPVERLFLLNDGRDEEAVVRNGPNGSGGKLHMVRPLEDTDIPWSALLLGLWIPNFFYWGLNQYIVQRTLGSKSLAEGQTGIVFAALLKLVIPFVVVIPGILAFNLYSSDLHASAARKNLQAFESSASSATVTLDVAVAELQPDLAARALQRNAALAGATVAPAASAEELAVQVNTLAAQAAGAGGGAFEGPHLAGHDYDAAFPVLVRNLLRQHWYLSWFVLAALFGAVVSSLAAMLNSASTIATMDLYAKFSKVTDGAKLVSVGRVFVVLFVLVAILVAPHFDDPKFGGIFKIIQEFQGFMSPGILAVFLVGFFVPRAPRYVGAMGILLNVVAYGALKWGLGDAIVSAGLWFAPTISFLDRMAICFLLVLFAAGLATLLTPLREPLVMPENKDMDLRPSRGAAWAGAAVLILTAVLYAVFW
ncbi:MAG: sodium:solute symporter family transporter [Chthoniobacterales bacterium]|jgi:SSS family solute:Na+ symporter